MRHSALGVDLGFQGFTAGEGRPIKTWTPDSTELPALLPFRGTLLPRNLHTPGSLSFLHPCPSQDPSPGIPSSFPRSSSGPSLDTLVSLHPSTTLPGPQKCARPHDSRVLAPTWGFLRPGRPPSLGFYSRTRSLIFLSQISLRPRPHGPAPPPSSVPGPPLTHTRSRSTASRAAQAPPSASAVCARSCASPSSRADSVAAASQRARASAGAAGAVRRETEFPTPRAPASKFVVCQLFACFALFESNLCGVYMAFWCHLHSFS